MAFLPILVTIFGIGMTFGYFTQLAKIIRNKSAKDVSLITYIFFGAGVTMWLIYGISIKDIPIIISNVIAVVGALSVVSAYLFYRQK